MQPPFLRTAYSSFVAVPALALALAACTTMAAPGPAKVSDGMLVGANGMTLYTFDRDPANAGKSACNGACATLWPPLTATAADQPSGAWSVIARDDGAHQWAYKGKPVYFYAKDKQAGDRTGDNFRDVWHTVKE
jgi:predicted lipoprotein with Yx(FWY)xxD motif